MRKISVIATISALLIAIFAVSGACADAFNIGDTVTFGSYPQGAEGETAPIEWTVLDIDGNGYYVLLSDRILDAKPYNESYTDVTWESCMLRAWLNNEFFNTAFFPDEQAMIRTTQVVNDNNPVWKSRGGYDTEDRVYLLSLDEITRYYGISQEDWYGFNDELRCAPTEYAAAKGAFVYDSRGEEEFAIYDGDGSWWLRSPGSNNRQAAAVYRGGSVHENGDGVPSASTGVRPVVRVRFE